MSAYRDLYLRATGREPYPYQERLATGADLPAVLHVPTGAGKTLAVLCAWLYRRLFADDAVRTAAPLRLVYALPMRVLVEQVWGVVNDALDRLDLPPAAVGRHLLMGGTTGPALARDWLRHPERPAVLVGTVDMLLSRALNRGYAAGRHRWPMEFGLLHADCLWVLDETQLMGVAATTAAQLEGLRERLGTWRRCHTIWMSATIDSRALATVDHPEVGEVLALGPEEVTGELGRRLEARKLLERRQGDAAAAVLAEHLPGSLTLVAHNTVKSAMETYRRLGRRPPAGGPELLLLHSRFRPPDRRRLTDRLAESMPAGGRVVCATQVVEAGVDLSARLLVTELAPWSSIVQRLGRCNRYGELEIGLARWLEPARPEPYRAEDLGLARSRLAGLEGGDVSAWSLTQLEPVEPPAAVPQVLRRRDLLDLFDTAPDLSGNDLDVSRFIRDAEDVDCRVFWRDWDGERPPAELPAAAADELCPVPVGELRKLIDPDRGRPAFAWDALDATWRPLRVADVRPGMVFLLPASAGGYTPETGWDPASKQPVKPVEAGDGEEPEANRGDPLTGVGVWLDLAAHTRDVERHAAAIAGAALQGAAPTAAADAVRLAARAHDVGKALPAFQAVLLGAVQDEAERARRQNTLWAKSAFRVRPAKRNPRHELASALALLQAGWLAERLAEPWAEVGLFLVAGHHGRARVTIRPWPDEQSEVDRPVLGVHDGEPLPQVRLDGLHLPAMELRLEPLRVGDGAGGGSWTTRMLGLRDRPDLGPFRLAHLEALLRAADWLASEEEEGHG